MDDTPIPGNPYDPEQKPLPFAGREEALSKLHQHLTEPMHTSAITFLGRPYIGKTALLRHFESTTSANHIGVYIPLHRVPLQNERMWLLALSQAVTYTLEVHSYLVDSTDRPADTVGEIREWLAQDHLPVIFRLIRPQRRLVLLLDNAEQLLNAVTNGALPQDTFTYLHSLLHPQLGIALALDIRYEDQLEQFYPLVNTNALHRLTNLSQEASTALMRQPADGFYTLTDESAAAIYKATGGEPVLLQRFGYQLYERARSGQKVISADDVKAISPTIYSNSEAIFQLAWKSLNRDERLVLTALSSLIYADPLRPVSTGMVETWLVETDYPLDTTAINAAIRGLEYRELVEGSASQISIAAGLMQKWLLENALLDSEKVPLQSSTSYNRLTWAAVALVIIIIVGILLAIGLNNPPTNENDQITSVPTITLLPGDDTE